MKSQDIIKANQRFIELSDPAQNIEISKIQEDCDARFVMVSKGNRKIAHYLNLELYNQIGYDDFIEEEIKNIQSHFE